jgi:cytochrome c oxidase assembly factor CtaG
MLATLGAHGLLAQAGALPPLTLHTAFTRWEFAPAITAGVVIAAVAYLVGVWRVRRDHPARPWPWLRTASFLAGLGVIVIATQSSVGAYDQVLFFMHMWQHLLLLMVAPPLLLAGRPVTLLLHASRNPLHSLVKRAVRSNVASAITFPLVGAGLYIATVVGTHLTGFMNLTLTHPVVHDGEHVLYLVAGYLYFLPLIGREPIRWRLSYPAQLFLFIIAMPVDTFTGVVLTQTNHEMFRAYIGRRDWGPSLVTDLHAGGAVMWIAGDGIMLVMILLLFASVLGGRVQFDAGRWLEAARAHRFSELAASGSTAGPDSTAGSGSTAGVGSMAGTAAGPDDDDRQWQAYNDYLARLNGEHGSPAGSAR